MAAPIHPLRIHRQDIRRFALAAVAIVAAAVAITSIQTITNNDTGTPASDVTVVNPANAASESAVSPAGNSLSPTGPSISAAAATTHSPVAEWAMEGGLTGLSPASVGPVVDTTDQPTSDTETSKIVTLEDELRAIHGRG